MTVLQNTAAIVAVGGVASRKSFFPRTTIKCEGPAVFRSQVARDVACLLDVDHSVRTWTCNPPSLLVSDHHYACDFLVTDNSGFEVMLDAPDRSETSTAGLLKSAAKSAGYEFRTFERTDLYFGNRLRNAKDLLRYGNYLVTLGDRVRLLAALDEHGALTVAECLTAFSETKPIGGLACMILNGFVDVDLDEALIGPRTTVKRISAA
ncbi:hypothetical protein LJR235_002827 [Pararhizobium sp. LjRoot235]|uniref:hypothetical protein n=1 Tax=Pararhizobium sp. LjRoot235 TaxID=3342291 RepID=UPI003ECFA7A2